MGHEDGPFFDQDEPTLSKCAGSKLLYLTGWCLGGTKERIGR